MAAGRATLRVKASRISTLARGEARRWSARRCLAIAATAAAAIVLQPVDAKAQFLPAADCPGPGQPVLKIPELTSSGGKLRATVVLADEQQRVHFTSPSPGGCALQYMRFFRGVGATPAIPQGQFKDPIPGPTLRARVGDLIQLSFLNHIDPNNYGNSIDRGENTGGCDETSGSPGYPQSAKDTFPNCFHGSSTGNIHFHGTHTNPNSTGDNVFLQIRPSPRPNSGPPSVTEASVKPAFDKFFAECESRLSKDVLSEWPYKWSDLPQDWVNEQIKLLQAYDAGTAPYSPPARPPAQQLWPVDKAQLDSGQWPQFYIGSYPYCFRLPDYTAPGWPPAAPPSGPIHVGLPGHEAAAALQMGQAPGTHWYHAHKHGSTALNVLNGMSGAFIIEGKYDDELNKFYGTSEVPLWTRAQPVLVVNQLGVSTNLLGAAGTAGGGPFAVNGRIQPKMTMRPGEVQLWRMVNSSSRSGMFFAGFQTSAGQPAPFAWKQIAQDGVQFFDINYRNSQNPTFTMVAGNRVDILVKAPANTTGQAQTFNVVVQPTVARGSLGTAVTLMTVEVSGAPVTGPQSQFIPRAPAFPPFLADITDDEVRHHTGTTITFNSGPPGSAHQHTVNGVQFDGTVGASVFLGVAEEWKIQNTTNATTGPGLIDHPFHIHVNPFQVVEVFDPNQKVKIASGALVDKYVFGPVQDASVQCSLNADQPSTWHDCHNVARRWEIWWDVFPVPSGKAATKSDSTQVIVPGYFRMRSRFVDFPGFFVLHCHILVHEDRGMMTVVEVRSNVPPFLHH
jgi:FtsP/CotA-like multicopper oxidase with cupredoxin domain